MLSEKSLWQQLLSDFSVLISTIELFSSYFLLLPLCGGEWESSCGGVQLHIMVKTPHSFPNKRQTEQDLKCLPCSRSNISYSCFQSCSCLPPILSFIFNIPLKFHGQVYHNACISTICQLGISLPSLNLLQSTVFFWAFLQITMVTYSLHYLALPIHDMCLLCL